MGRQSLKNVLRMIDEANQSVPVEQSFLADLKRSIELTEEQNARQPSQTYKPSSMQCIRNMYYQVVGAERDKSKANATLIGICESGTDRHERIQNAVENMKNHGIDCEYIDVAEFVKSRELSDLEIKDKKGNETHLYSKSLNMSFLCDGIIRYKGVYYVLEIKTESIYKWQSRQGVAEEHLTQGTAYATVFNIPNVIFLYINRDNTDMKAYMLEVDAKMRYEFKEQIAKCNEYVNSNTVPPKPENVSKKACMYCNYSSLCKKEVSDGDK